MKKVLIGCGIGCIVLIAIVIAAGFWMFRTGQRLVQATEQIKKDYEAANAANPFTEPESDAVIADQITRWLAVRESLQPQSSAWVKNLEQNKNSAFKAIGTAIEGAGQIMTAHAVALREKGMSAHEYQWITQRVVTALQSGDASADADLAPLATMLQEMQAAARNQSGKQSNDINFNSDTDLSVPMTSGEIAATIAAMKPSAAAIQNTRDVFTTDFMLLPMIDGMSVHTQTRDESSTEALDAALDKALNPAPAQ